MVSDVPYWPPEICPLGEKSLELETRMADFESVPICASIRRRVCSGTVSSSL